MTARKRAMERRKCMLERLEAPLEGGGSCSRRIEMRRGRGNEEERGRRRAKKKRGTETAGRD
jgi:hypothetical protein